MIKAMANLPDGGALLVLGITKENVRELMADNPICFKASEMELPLPDDRYIVVSYIHPDGLIFTPTEEELPDAFQLVITLDDASLARLTTQTIEALMPGTTVRLCLVYRETQGDLDRIFVPFIGPRTKSTRTGFPPGFDFSRN